MKYRLVILLLISFCVNQLSAQFTPFAYTYGGNGSETGYGIVESPDSGYVCTGQTGTNSVGSSDVFLFKTNINGELLWKKNIGGTGAEGGNSITNGHGGGYILAGYTNSMGSGGYDFYVIRTDDSGDTIWTRTYGGEDWDLAYSVASTADGNYLVCGEKYNATTGTDVWILKINDSGDTLRTWTWGSAGNQIGRQIKELEAGTAVVVGYGFFPPNSDEDAILLGINHQSGSYLFETIVEETGHQRLYSIDSSTTGGYIGFGLNQDIGQTKDLLLHYFNENGNLTQSIDIAGSNDLYDLEIYGGFNFKNQKYYVAGSSKAIGLSDYECLFFELDPAGYVTLGRVITAPRLNSIKDIFRSSDNGFVMAGISEGIGPGVSGAIIWKLDSTFQSVTNPIQNLSNFEEELTLNLKLLPNPHQDMFWILAPDDFNVSEIRIFNLNGSLVLEMEINPNEIGFSVSTHNLSPGVFFIELTDKHQRKYYSKIIKQ